MLDIISQFLAGIMSVWLLLVGVVTNEPVVVTEQAAALQLVIDDNQEFVVEEEYISLFDVISNSVEKLKDSIASGTGVDTLSLTTTAEEEIATSSENNVGNLGEAIVNIVCVQKTDTYKRTASGTGFIINSKGVILTNAHVAQFLLLEKAEDLGTTICQARIGDEDEAAYDIDLLYISPTWLLKHADFINTAAPRGNGEGDFALLYVTDTLRDRAMPESFPYLPPATSVVDKDVEGDTVILVGYPSNGTPVGVRTVATTSITNLYTFGGGYVDIISLAESPLGHQGASGGPVIDKLGRSIGIITTKNTNSTALHAITLSHVNRTLQAETGYDLANTIGGDLPYRAKLFGDTVYPILSQILAEEAADVSAFLDQ